MGSDSTRRRIGGSIVALAAAFGVSCADRDEHEPKSVAIVSDRVLSLPAGCPSDTATAVVTETKDEIRIGLRYRETSDHCAEFVRVELRSDLGRRLIKNSSGDLLSVTDRRCAATEGRRCDGVKVRGDK